MIGKYLFKAKRISRHTTQTVPFSLANNILDAIVELKNESYQLIALEITNKSTSLDKFLFDKEQKYAFIIGNEKNGITAEILNLVDDTIHINMFGINSSLNVTTATAILLHEYTRVITEDIIMC